jgi:hypothetical protein
MSITASLIALVILLGALLLVRRTQKSITERPKASKPALKARGQVQDTKFHAVSIRLGASACTAAKELQGERFLASDAPMFPLEGCDAANCNCRFVHYKDRRSRDDRRNPYRGSMGVTTGNLKQEQRTGAERRKNRHDD